MPAKKFEWKRKTFNVTKASDSKKAGIMLMMKGKGWDKFSIGYEGKKKYYIFWKQVAKKKLKKVI